ncbi:hypothetical protein M885DRAFT_460613 [Pelagophyceae sp. CCMP2097]|nr:hypothetical protein M885DRAFT_460613 [Pelagophyceae sp. CCMP2097]
MQSMRRLARPRAGLRRLSAYTEWSGAGQKLAAAAIAERGEELGIHFYQFAWVDLFGVQRSKLVPAKRVRDLAKSGAGFAGFAAHLDMDPTMGDLIAMPDASTLVKLPWKPQVGWVACDLVHNGAELPHGPRNVLRKVLRALDDKGIVMKTGVECEFFLFAGEVQEPNGLIAPKPSDALDSQRKPCYDAHALMRRYDLVSKMSDSMEEMGWGPYQADHEDASGQFEVNWDYDDALKTADRVVLFKYMARVLAEEAGLRASFMPKPFANLTGSGCHAHISLHDKGTGANLCGDKASPKHGISEMGLSFVAGLLKHARASAAITNPTVNSYKRLGARSTSSGATWSPGAVTWAGNNRTALIRVPDGPARFELRGADMAANPYLFAAAVGAAGLDGLNNKATPPPPADINMYDGQDPAVAAVRASSDSLPADLGEALHEFKSSAALREGLGADFCDSYSKLRDTHWSEYSNSQISQWELQHYLDC